MTTRAERIQEEEREQEFGKQEDSSSRTSPTAEDRPIRGPRGGLRAPGPAITRHRQTIHKASRREGGGRSVERRKDITGGGSSLDGFAMPLPLEFWMEFYRHHQSAL